MNKKATIIGSGIAGIALAVRLSLKGYEVEIFEANDHVGGKIYQVKNSEYRFDAGPSLITLPHLLDDLFQIAKKNRSNYINYFPTPVTCKYFFEDNTTIKAYTELIKFKSEVEKAGLNPDSLEKYLKHNRFVFENIADIFLHRPIHQISTFINIKTLKALLKLPKYKILRSVHAVNKLYLKSSKLVQIFDRYITYGGSNPYKAPGILTLISHLENNLGAYMIEDGMYNLAPALYKLAQDVGVKFNLNTKVLKILVENNRVTGIQTASDKIDTDLVISNADVYYTYKNLLPHHYNSNIHIKQPLSLSAIVFYWGIKKKFSQLELHNVFFSEDYKNEFSTMFEKKDIYNDPTIYVYISSKINKKDAKMNSENWYVSVFIPPDIAKNCNQYIQETKNHVLNKLSRILKTDIESLIEFERIDDPINIEKYTSSYKGALYGPNSNKKFSAFLRHPNYCKKIKGLYFCGGTVHPGGGIPLCLLSAKITAEMIEKHSSKKTA